MVRIVLACLVMGFDTLAHAQTPDPNKLEDVTARQAQAQKEAERLAAQQKAIRAEIQRLENELKQASTQARSFETESAEISERLSNLANEEMTLQFSASRDRDALADLLAAMLRIEQSPPPALLLNTEAANQAAQSAILFRSISEALSERSQALQERLDKLSAVRTSIVGEQVEYDRSTQEMHSRLKNLRAILREKARLDAKLDTDKKKRIEEAKVLADEAETLRELINRFESRAETDINTQTEDRVFSNEPVPRLKPKLQAPTTTAFIPSSAKRFSDARGSLPLPVLGKPRLRYGSLLNSGARSKGVSLKTAPNAQVIAPFAGRVEYSGEFNGDNVVILNVGGGYFLVMTGLGETFTQAGARVRDGEPLGLMPETTSPQPELFLEFRKDRASINPNPWIGKALSKAKS